MTDSKTKPTGASIEKLLSKVGEVKRADSLILINLLRQITGHEPVMWGPSIIGFDSYHYKYTTGREGDMCAAGFSPRKASLVVYIVDGFDNYKTELSKLGKHSHGVSCLYINSLADVNLEVLRDIITKSYKATKSKKW